MQTPVPVCRNLLEELALQHGATKRWHDYLIHYDRLLGARRHEVRRVLEIGLRAPNQAGSSVGMWGEYFPNSILHGLDINPRNADLSSSRATITIEDSASPGAGDRFAARHGGDFDLIIDDGSHWYADQVATFLNFWPLLKKGGTYVVEDLACGDGPHRYLAVDAFRELVDGLNYIAPNVSTGHWYLTEALPQDAHPLVNSVESVTFVRNACFIVKGDMPHGNPFLVELRQARRVPIAQTPARAGGSILAKLRRALVVARDRHRRFLIPARFARPPGFLTRLLGRIG